MKKTSVAVIVGSARTGSFSKAVAECLVELMPEEVEARLVNIADLPIYNQDFDGEGKTPESYERFRKEIGDAEAYLFVTPEHNRSIPALLKNALDVASRPMGSNAWSGKPGAIVSVSPGGIGGFGANHIARQSMSFLNIFMMQQPEAYVGNVMDMLDENGKVTAERSRDFLKSVAGAFTAWVARFQK